MKKIAIGTIVYSTNTGLGVELKDFTDHIDCKKVMLADISKLNGTQTHHERFPGAFITTNGFPVKEEIDRFLEGLDLVFIKETPLDYYLFERANELGIKTILDYNWEFLDYLNQPDLPKPTFFKAPTLWHYNDLPFENKKYLNVPVNRELLKPRDITGFKNFLHIAGRPAVHDRNGTETTIRAFNKVHKVGISLTVRVQDKVRAEELKQLVNELKDSRIIIDENDVENYWEIYNGFDCLIMPRKYGGLCLPMQEALSCGMPVIMTDVSPNNEFLPMNWLVPANKTGEFQTRSTIDIFEASAELLAKYIEEFATMGAEKAIAENEVAKSLGDYLSWEKMKPRYLQLFEDVCNLKQAL